VTSIEVDERGMHSASFPISLPQEAVGEIVRVLVDALSADSTEKPKSTVQWVPSHFNVPAVVRLYDHLFMMEDPPDAEWEKALNPSSLLVKGTALVDPSIFKWGTTPETHFQVS
jgi:hypothetical protein